MALEHFISKKFSSAHQWVIKQANAIIDEYLKQGYTLTLRQVHYQFVARDLYENTQQNYKRLGKIIDEARKAGLIDWDAIEDRTRGLRRISIHTNPEAAVAQLEKHFLLNPWLDQPVRRHVEVWVEKDAAVGIVQPTCDALRIPYFSCRGYSSSSGLYEAGKRLAAYRDAGYETLVLYLGDHDPSGVQMTDVANERLSMYARSDIEFRRIALTMAQVEQYSPPPNFTKETDSRTKWYETKFETDECWELDALTPKVVDNLIRGHVEPLIDKNAWDATMEREKDDKAVLSEIISDWQRTKAAPEMARLLRSFAMDYEVSEHPSDEGEYASEDSATLASFIDESEQCLLAHKLL